MAVKTHHLAERKWLITVKLGIGSSHAAIEKLEELPVKSMGSGIGKISTCFPVEAAEVHERFGRKGPYFPPADRGGKGIKLLPGFCSFPDKEILLHKRATLTDLSEGYSREEDK
jgi:hypothetical protein